MKNDYERVASVADRIRTAMNERNIKQVQLANVTGLSSGIISSYLSGKFEPKNTAIAKLAKALNVSPAWLCGFKVPMEVPSYNKETGLLTIPFISQKLSAGPGEDFLSDDCLEVRTIDVLACMLRGVEDRSTLVCAEAKGDSMVGARIYSGDYVVFSRGLVNEEGIYVLSLCGDVLVKRLSFDKLDNRLSIISENPRYPVKTVDADDPNVRILGKVVGWIHSEPA